MGELRTATRERSLADQWCEPAPESCTGQSVSRHGAPSPSPAPAPPLFADTAALRPRPHVGGLAVSGAQDSYCARFSLSQNWQNNNTRATFTVRVEAYTNTPPPRAAASAPHCYR